MENKENQYPKFKIRVKEPINNGIYEYYPMVKKHWWTPWLVICEDAHTIFPEKQYTEKAALFCIQKYLRTNTKYKTYDVNIDIDKTGVPNISEESSWFPANISEKPEQNETLVIQTNDGLLLIGYYDTIGKKFRTMDETKEIKNVAHFKILKNIPKINLNIS